MRDPFAEVSDTALVLGIARYHQEALAEAYRRHAGAVFGLARRLLSARALAEEVVQEVFLRLWNDPDRFDPSRGALRSYLLASAHGRAVDLLRSEGARRAREDKDARRTADCGYDAVDDEERREIETYLAVDHRARAEVEMHREVATLMAFSGAAAPEGLWDRIADALDERPPQPGPELARVLPVARRRRWSRAMLVGAGAAAATVTAAITVAVVHESERAPVALDSMAQVFDRAMADPDATRAVLRSDDVAWRAVAVVEPGGLGVISLRELPDLGPERTYQLWGVVDDEMISLGVLGHRPGVEPFTVSGDLSALVVTDEVAGGVASSTQPALLSGTVA